MTHVEYVNEYCGCDWDFDLEEWGEDKEFIEEHVHDSYRSAVEAVLALEKRSVLRFESMSGCNGLDVCTIKYVYDNDGEYTFDIVAEFEWIGDKQNVAEYWRHDDGTIPEYI